jgi:hypothetical protein
MPRDEDKHPFVDAAPAEAIQPEAPRQPGTFKRFDMSYFLQTAPSTGNLVTAPEFALSGDEVKRIIRRSTGLTVRPQAEAPCGLAD